MSAVFEKNITILREKHPYLYTKLDNYLKGSYRRKEDSVERILLAKQDDQVFNMLVVCKGEEFLLCDHENPIHQAYSWIDKYIDPSNKAEIVFGMGFGFHLDVLIGSFKNKKVIIVEPDIELFYQVLNVRDVRKILESCQLIVDEPVDVIMSSLATLFWDKKEGGIGCEPFEVYARMFEGLWTQLRSKFIKQAQSFSVDIVTRKYFGELWMHNYIKNANRMNRASHAHGLMGSFRGIPGILVAAGPSLSKNIHLLKDLTDKCVMMAAGTAVRILQEHNIQPHFMVGIDASDAEAEIHKRVRSRDIAFIYSNQVAPGSITAYEGPKFVMNYTADIFTAQFMSFAGIPSEPILSGPSVANTCFDLLYKMGCNPIILVGQDLAYTDNRLYGGKDDKTVVNDVTNFHAEGYVLEKDIHGNDVYTRTTFISMKNWFEGYFAKVGNTVEIVNATEGGLNIEYARNEKLSDIIQKLKLTTVDIQGRIRNIYKECLFDDRVIDRLSEYKEYVRSEILKLEKASKAQLKLADLIDRGVYHPAKDKKSFEKVVQRVAGLTDKVMESPIYYSVLRNLVEIEFFLISKQVDVATSGMSSYEEAKRVYIDAIREQNKILTERLSKVKKYLEEES